MNTQNSTKEVEDGRRGKYESKRARMVVSFNTEVPFEKELLDFARSIEGGFSAWVKEKIRLRMATHPAPAPEAFETPRN